MQKIALTSFGVLAAFAIIASDPSQTPAQQLAPTIVLSSGELLEIGVDTDLVRPEFSWILTRDREFVNAQRSRFFQTRQTQAGTYTLDVSIQSEDRQRSEFHTFQIEVTQALPPSPFPTGSGSSVIVPNIMTEPSASINGTISVDPQGDLIKIDASRSTGPVERFLVDLDTSKDSNGDGIADRKSVV